MPEYLGGRIIAETGDITQIHADAVVNAANSSLLGGGGVDGAIHRAGEPTILEECREIRKSIYPNGLPTGKAVATKAGRLPAKFVIHTVGPVWHGGTSNEDGLLADAYTNSLLEAEKLRCLTIAFPAISTGIYGFPPERAAGIVSKVLESYYTKGGTIKTIYLVFFSQNDLSVFMKNTTLPR